MKNYKIIILFLISLLFVPVVFFIGVFWPLAYVEVVNTERTVVIADISIVDVEHGVLIPNSTLVIEGDRIANIISLEHVSPPEGALVIDGSGKFLMPALWDMHVHTYQLSPQLYFPLSIAYGITNVRDMGSAIANSGSVWSSAIDKRMWNTQIEKGELIGPRLMGISSFPVNGTSHRHGNYPSFSNASTPEEARQLVRYFKDRNLDFIKVYNNILPEPFLALMDEAQKVGIDVVGHRPARIGAIEASNAGMKSFEHARLFLKEGYAGAKAFRSREDINRAYTTEVRREMIEMNDDTITAEIFRRLVENDTWFCPTHGTQELDAFADIEGYRNDSRLKYIHPFFKSRWHKHLEYHLAKEPSPIDRKIYLDFYLAGLKLTGKAHAAGVNIIAGTDANDIFIFPGSGLHQELRRFVRAGLSPAEALQTATLNPARYFDVLQDFGTVSVGKKADLVILNANPLEDIGNTETIDFVLFNGNVYPKDQLNSMADFVEEQASSLFIYFKLLWQLVY